MFLLLPVRRADLDGSTTNTTIAQWDNFILLGIPRIRSPRAPRGRRPSESTGRLSSRIAGRYRRFCRRYPNTLPKFYSSLATSFHIPFHALAHLLISGA